MRATALTRVQSYCAAAPWTLRADRLRWYALVQYVTRAYRFCRQQTLGWEQALQQAVSNLGGLDAVLAVLDG